MTYGGDGHGAGAGSTTDLCNFMFPGTSDAEFPGQEWTEVTAGNIPADRRFLQSAGPFTLEPGAVNTITTGVVLGLARAAGETAPLIFTALFSYYHVTSISDIFYEMSSLSVLIYNFALEPYDAQNQLAWAASLILIIIILSINIFSRWLSQYSTKP